MFKVPTTTIYSRYHLPKSLPPGGGDVLSTPLRAFSRYHLPKSLPPGGGDVLSTPLRAFLRYPLPKSLPSGEGLTFTLSPQAVKR